MMIKMRMATMNILFEPTLHAYLIMSIYSTFIDFLTCSMSIPLLNMDTEWIIQHRTVSSSMLQLPKLCLTLINCCAHYDFGDSWPLPLTCNIKKSYFIRTCPGSYSLWSQVGYSPHWTRYGFRICSRSNTFLSVNIEGTIQSSTVTSSLMTSAQNAILKCVTIFDISLK